MSGQRWKAIGDLVPGDMIKLSRPATRARVIGVKAREYVQFDQLGRRLGTKERGWEVDFEMMDGAERGRRDYACARENDRVWLG